MPSLTEMAFFLELGPNIVGVTPYCNFPAAALEREKVGSAVMLDYEKITKLAANIVLFPNIKNNQAQLDVEKMHIKTMILGYDRLSEVIEGMHRLASLNPLKSQEKAREFEMSFEALRPAHPKKVLIVISEEVKGNYISSVRVAASETIYDDLIQKLGHSNSISKPSKYPVLSLENLMNQKFDLILRLGPIETAKKNIWLNSSFKNKINFIESDYSLIPGPRLTLLYKDLKKTLND